jgi:hypothetical protein
MLPAVKTARTSLAFVAALMMFIWSVPLQAQWLKYKTPGIPRTSDGKPDLTAPAPRTADGKPDLSGLWHADQAGGPATEKAIAALPPQPWAEALSKKRVQDLGKDDPGVLCQPLGPRADAGIRKVVQTPALIVILYDDLTYRQIFLDGRTLEDDPNPAWMGYAVGHWDGDTLVVQSAGFNDRTWLDDKGHPHSEALRVTERIRRLDFGHLEVQRTMEDPKALTKPLAIPLRFELDADTEMIEYVCTENERDRQNLVGKASDEKKAAIRLAPEILSRYAGAYEYKPPERPGLTLVFNATLEGERLMFDTNGGLKRPLIPQSENTFFWEDSGGQVEFVKDSDGSVTHLVIRIVEGDFKAQRKNTLANDAKR